MKEQLQIALDDLGEALGNDYRCAEWTLTRHRDGSEENKFRFYHNLAGWGKTLPDMAEAFKSCLHVAPYTILNEIGRKKEELDKLEKLLTTLETNAKHD